MPYGTAVEQTHHQMKMNLNSLILGFTGTTAGPRPAQTAAIRRFITGLYPARLVHGGAKGSDMIAHRIAESLRVPEIEIHPAADRSPAIVMGNGITVYPELPPLERNRIIVSRIHGLLACPRIDTEEIGSGTWATVRYARKLGCPVYLVRVDGRIERDRKGLK